MDSLSYFIGVQIQNCAANVEHAVKIIELCLGPFSLLMTCENE